MKVSGEQYLRVSALRAAASLPREMPSLGSIATAPAHRPALGWAAAGGHSGSDEVRRLATTVAEGEEVREQVVASLRAQIEAGNYAISGEQIAEMMLRRFLADRVR